MQIDELFELNGAIYRVLAVENEKILLIDCVKKSMPRWYTRAVLDGARQITQDDLLSATRTNLVTPGEITQAEKRTAYEKYGSISLIIPVIADEAKRTRAIDICSAEYGLSKNTIRCRLCLFLAYKDINIFLAKAKPQRPLTQDEKNFRWALNRWFYTSFKFSLIETYRRMLKEKYCDENGYLLSVVPSFRQFNYYFYKTVSKTNQLITREGKGKFMRDHRVTLGSVRDYCETIGYGMVDSCVLDIFLVNDAGALCGRPILTACVDGYSGLCLGYSLGYEGGVSSLVKLVENMVADKKEHCRRFGIEIAQDDWPCAVLPQKLITDKGKEYCSESFSQIADLGVEIINLAPYRPDSKGVVEKFFDLIQSSFKNELANKGVIFENYQERGGVDYRKKATLTIKELEKIIILCIMKNNAKRVINLPFDKVGLVEPFACKLWNYCLPFCQENLITVSREMLRLTLLPRRVGRFTRKGLIVGNVRYKNFAYDERCLRGGECIVAYDPTDASKVYLVEDDYAEFNVIEQFFEGKTVEEIDEILKQKKLVEQQARPLALQAEIDLSANIARIVNSIVPPQKVIVTGVRQNKFVEKHKGDRK